MDDHLISCVVSYKKRSGTILITASRFKWRSDGSNEAEFIVPYDMIKAQHVNLAGSGKILLKVTIWAQKTTPESNHTFSFQSLEDREAVKEYLAQKISQQRAHQQQTSGAVNNGNTTTANSQGSGGNVGDGKDGRLSSGSLNRPPKDTTGNRGPLLTASEIRARQILLAKDLELAKLHKEMVVDGVLEEEQFWDSRRKLLTQQQFLAMQKRGSTTASLANIQPTSTEGNDIKYTLTPELIHSIFVHYPAIQKAYKDLVPLKLSEPEFWKQYFLSKYFSRASTTVSAAGTAAGAATQQQQTKSDIFDKYETDEDLNEPRTEDVKNKLVDLTTTAEDHLKGFGNQPDITMKAGRVKESLPLIRKFNRHSEIVLKSNLKNKDAQSNEEDHGSKHFLKETEIEDLEKTHDPQYIPMETMDQTKYVHADTKKAQVASQKQKVFYTQIQEWKQDLAKDILNHTSKQRLDHLTHRSLKRKRQIEGHHETMNIVSKETMDQVKSLHVKSNELLRHFWANYSGLNAIYQDPAIAEEKKRKCLKLVDALHEAYAAQKRVFTTLDKTQQEIVSHLLYTLKSCMNYAKDQIQKEK